MTVTFSERFETQRPPGLIDRSVPDKVRNRFQWLLSELLPERDFHWLRRDIYGTVGLGFSQCLASNVSNSREKWHYCRCRNDVNLILSNCPWDTFYDIVEVFQRWFVQHNEESAAEFESGINKVFSAAHLAYTLREGKVERVAAAQGDRIVAVARGILLDEDLAGPSDQFEKALSFFNHRPEPDTENCVKEAVGAAEGVARVLLNKPAILLNNAASEFEKNYGLHPALRQAIEKVYAYRGDAEGAAHGKTGSKPGIRTADAEFVLNTSAAIIIYVARLFDRTVE